jgi:mRNA interferase MazF
VISNDLYHGTHLDAVVLARTSNLSTSDYKVLIETQALLTGSLPVKSAVRVDKPFSVLQSKVLKIQAKITSAKFEEVKAVIAKLIE